MGGATNSLQTMVWREVSSTPLDHQQALLQRVITCLDQLLLQLSLNPPSRPSNPPLHPHHLPRNPTTLMKQLYPAEDPLLWFQASGPSHRTNLMPVCSELITLPELVLL